MKKFFKIPSVIIVTTFLVFFAFVPKDKVEVREDFKKFYDEQKVEGSFVVLDQNMMKYTAYNPKQYRETFSPASTFKICNSLIGLETGVLTDENFVIKWDSIIRPNTKWNKDHSLKSAFQNSTVWYYQELARRVGGEKMKYWLNKAQYGNADTSGGIDLFWLKGGLRISPEQQVNFLKRFRNNQLPFSKRSVDIVKKIMIADSTAEYVLRAKTGWADNESGVSVGWYVGYVETKDNVYYFSNCIQTKDFDKAKARIDITYQILRELKIIPSNK